ncbi:hypothetical protein [Halostagnicola sp. A-GB9-2]|uniref:hypothetical protein n=1 Tax=Halostagnicola sp. A-GB9-2 TaxID=3048066 RepID=UPI0024BF6231|nr:hypothetical protein [Halostagnicola sp. A-GB9-2]MDJ1431567.1 hypothetical protein [Halostagnicola sp. A-GB9-2]
MERRSVLLGAAVVLAGFSAFAHLIIGFEGLLGSVADGALSVVPILFIVSAVLVVALLVSLARGTLAPPTVYLAGGVLMVLHLFAYADVHALGYFETATGVDMHDHGGGDGHDHNGDDHSHDGDGHDHNGDGHDHNGDDHSHDHDGDGHDHNGDDGHDHNGDDHDGAAHEVVIDHLREDVTALLTKVAETGAAIAFFALYALER